MRLTRHTTTYSSVTLSSTALLLLSLPLVSSHPHAQPNPHPHAHAGSLLHFDDRTLHARNIITDPSALADSYDFIIAGGGTAGLVLASRLSEDSNTTVLVLEAGDTGDAVKTSINIPGDAYYASLLGSSSDWAYTTVSQPSANARQLAWPRGKVLGGSSAVNGMYLVRPSSIEFDAWTSLLGGIDGVSEEDVASWSWDTMFEAMKKSETFGAPSASIQKEAGIEFVQGSHGDSGPLHYSYPGFTFPQVADWSTTLANLGIPTSPDAYSGNTTGAFVATSAINPTNWTRSYSRSAYIDPLPPRPNLAILPNALVTRLIFANSSSSGSSSTSLNATAVEFADARDSTSTRTQIKVNREVLLAGGAIGSPQILMVSGVGPSDVLQAAGVDVLLELPGVGQHLQDHISTQVTFSTNDDTAGSLYAANSTQLAADTTSNPFLSYINSATSYITLPQLLGTSASSFISSATSSLPSLTNPSSPSFLVPSTSSEVINGFQAIYNQTVGLMGSGEVGVVELLLSLVGNGVIGVQAALQHPLSQGRLWITSPDAFTYPAIDPGYLSNDADLTILREALKLARKVGNTAPLSSSTQTETSPGSSVSSDADWEAWLKGQIGTEFHPSCSCAMMPLESGGVVDARLRVYGISNVRVVDASVYPIQFAAHLAAPTYGLAEQAANIIRAQYNFPPPTNTSSSSNSTATNSTTGADGADGSTTTTTTKTGAGVRSVGVGVGVKGLVAFVVGVVGAVSVLV